MIFDKNDLKNCLIFIFILTIIDFMIIICYLLYFQYLFYTLFTSIIYSTLIFYIHLIYFLLFHFILLIIYSLFYILIILIHKFYSHSISSLLNSTDLNNLSIPFSYYSIYPLSSSSIYYFPSRYFQIFIYLFFLFILFILISTLTFYSYLSFTLIHLSIPFIYHQNILLFLIYEYMFHDCYYII